MEEFSWPRFFLMIVLCRPVTAARRGESSWNAAVRAPKTKPKKKKKKNAAENETKKIQKIEIFIKRPHFIYIFYIKKIVVWIFCVSVRFRVARIQRERRETESDGGRRGHIEQLFPFSSSCKSNSFPARLRQLCR